MVELGGLAVPESALAWKFVRASGPGGQNVNKVSTAVECRLDLAAAALPPSVRARLERVAGSRLNGRGEVVLFTDAHRTQARNRAAALARLDALVAAARQVPKPRVPTKPSKAQRTRRREDKKRRGEVKQSRRPPDDY
ncbi:MAG: alternative ribosome rescue aminoacyl-tRNA hydrolase ArfB [Gammaproteobacteria bacterium]|nr:alternative ribosome rescue aminoacyl-tRNA hydrolase ArfB [Gammaproteobacteria bacterium]